MIDLQLPIAFDKPMRTPFVVKTVEPGDADLNCLDRTAFGIILSSDGEWVEVATVSGLLHIHAPGTSIVGDVLYVDPLRRTAHRWFRRGETQNTLLITERCDQLCVMCSQPPKKSHTDLFEHFERACRLADTGADIGLSGGEPTLYKAQLFRLIERVSTERSDLRFHILTNAQHFEREDIGLLAQSRDRVVWGVPVYSAEPLDHDVIVGKPGAFERLETSLAILSEASATVELRSVVMRQTAAGLPRLARWLGARMPGALCWAIMQLEQTGFARGRWHEQFYDHSADFEPIGDALTLARARGLPTYLYNFPRCTVPEAFREYCPSTISDWKRAYPEACSTCSDQELCSGLFAWHSGDVPFSAWGAL